MVQNILLSILSGVISGVIASVLLNHYYWNNKPKLFISNYISKNIKGEYRIKIINKSNGNGGNILNVINLDIPYKTLQIIDPYDKDNLNAPYAIRFVIANNLEELWKEDKNTYLKLMIYCSNEHNNASKLYEHIYYKKTCIKNGDFKFGDSFEIEQ